MWNLATPGSVPDMNPFSFPGEKKDVTERGKKNGSPLLGNPFFFPAEAGLSQALPWPPGGTHFFSPPRAGPGMPVGLPLILTKYLISHWFYMVFCDFRPQVESTFEQNTSFYPVF